MAEFEWLEAEYATQDIPEVPEVLADRRNLRFYRRLELLGEGGYGKCYKMKDIFNNEIFAVKVIPVWNSAWLEESLQEVAILEKLQHRHVVGFSHYMIDDNFLYIFMELCSRGAMVDILAKRASLTTPELRYYMSQLIAALKHMHGEGFVHRDLKLENLLLTEDLELRLADFGLAAKLEPLETRDTYFCGTSEYAAPEVWKEEGHGPESDVWALGCIMYTLLVGELPFHGTDEEIQQCVMEVKYAVPKSLSVSARNLISWIFQKNPGDRPTLDQILNHKFFTKGFTPAQLPPDSYHTVPKLKAGNRVERFFIRLFHRAFGKKRSKEPRCESKQQGEQQDSSPQ